MAFLAPYLSAWPFSIDDFALMLPRPVEVVPDTARNGCMVRGLRIIEREPSSVSVTIAVDTAKLDELVSFYSHMMQMGIIDVSVLRGMLTT